MSSNKTRQIWNSKAGFILSAIGSAVGLGNIWRFPYVLYENGGGGFLIPYFIAIFTAAIPLLILEYSLGSKFRASAPLAFARINKKFEIIGWLPTFLGLTIILYYSSIVSWAINYVILSFNSGWGTNPEGFFFGEFLNTTKSPFILGEINLPILIGLAIVWGGTFFLCSNSVDKGIEKVNKVLLPVLVISLIIIVIRGILLDGAAVGLNTLFTPDFSVLSKPDVWLAAYSQVFFSLSVAMGVMITYSSYLPKNSDVVNTAYITGLANSTFEFTIAIGIFGILGYMATQQGVAVQDVVAGGVGLAFIVFPEAFNLMGSFGKILGVVFFSTLVFAGFTSFVSLTEAVIMPIIDKFKVARKKVYLVVCSLGFLISSVFATGAGLLILDIVDNFVNLFVLISIGILEAIAIGYLYKIGKIKDYANKVSSMKIGLPWVISITFIVPVLLTFNLILSIRDTLINGYDNYTNSELLFFGLGVIIVIVLASFIFNMLPWKNPKDLDFVDED